MGGGREVGWPTAVWAQLSGRLAENIDRQEDLYLSMKSLTNRLDSVLSRADCMRKHVQQRYGQEVDRWPLIRPYSSRQSCRSLEGLYADGQRNLIWSRNL